jgi:hypothetical protein
MAEGQAATAAGEGSELFGMLLEEVGGKPFVPEEQEKPDSEEIIDSSDETEASEEKSEDATEDVEATKDDESEDEAKDEGEAPEPDKVQRRIDKLTAQKKEALEKAQSLETEATQAKTRLAELEAQLNESSRPVLSPTAENPLADVDTPEALDAKIKSAQEVRRWALRNTDGATVKRPDGSETYVDSDQVKEYLIKADDILTLHAPARQQWLAQRQPSVEAARNVFPDIFKKGTDMHAAYQATVKQAPELLKLPQHEYWVGLALYGEAQLMANQKVQAAKATAAKKVSSASESKTPTPANPVSSAKSTTKGTVRRDVRDRVMSGGAGLDDIASFMSDRLFG